MGGIGPTELGLVAEILVRVTALVLLPTAAILLMDN
jgi:hypothetical protein